MLLCAGFVLTDAMGYDKQTVFCCVPCLSDSNIVEYGNQTVFCFYVSVLTVTLWDKVTRHCFAVLGASSDSDTME